VPREQAMENVTLESAVALLAERGKPLKAKAGRGRKAPKAGSKGGPKKAAGSSSSQATRKRAPPRLSGKAASNAARQAE